ncbi:MAG TPA: protoporphyrinogen oxidase [Jiangellaceae bacterium]|nr:protoporphyrinogen oxidase [Jiangellaceae bacterium]
MTSDDRRRPRRRRRHVVVVGGGVSGLSAAYYLTRAAGGGVHVTVLDKAPLVGGHLRVGEVAGVPVDLGAESLLNRRPEAVGLARTVGLGDDIVHPAPLGAGLWTRGSVVPLPRRTVMGVPADPAELAAVLDTDEVAVVEAEPDLAGMPLPPGEDVAIGRLVSGRMGRAVVDRLVEPLLAGVYAGHADELSLRATVPALAVAAGTHRSLIEAAASVIADEPGAEVPVFAGIRGGVGRLPAAIADASGADVRTGVTVRGLAHMPYGWRIETGPAARPEAVDADAVIVAVPATPAARLLRDAVPMVSAELTGLEYASVAVVTMALPRAAFPAVPVSSGFLVPPVEGRVTKAVTLSAVKWPWLAEAAGDLVVLRASVGRHRTVADLQREDGELVDLVLADLTEALGVTDRPVDSMVTRWGGALPQYAVGHQERMSRATAAAAAVPGLALCGAAYQGVGIAACVASAQQAAAGILGGFGLVPVSEA